jgi:MscS family membrane protein
MSTIVLLLGFEPAHAQEPKVKDVLQQEEAQENEKAAAEQAPQGPVDEFNRGTPRSSFLGLAEAAREGDFERAAEYLDLRNLPDGVLETGGPELARRFKIVLDRALWIDVDTLSRDPRGVSDDGLPDYRDSLGRIEIDGKRIDIHMQRIPRGDGVSIWKISNATVGKIPELHGIYGYGVIGEKLSKVMPDFEFLGLQTWQWLMVVGLLGIGYLVALVPTWFIGWLVRRNEGRLSDELARFVSGPIPTGRRLSAALGEPFGGQRSCPSSRADASRGQRFQAADCSDRGHDLVREPRVQGDHSGCRSRNRRSGRCPGRAEAD